MIVDDLPTGHLTFFIINMLVSYFFSFVGFLLTYLLHTSHAAKYGSRAGLGLTLIQYGFVSRSRVVEDERNDPMAGMGMAPGSPYWNMTTGRVETAPGQPVTNVASLQNANGTMPQIIVPEGYDLTGRDWLAFLFMTLGAYNSFFASCLKANMRIPNLQAGSSSSHL